MNKSKWPMEMGRQEREDALVAYRHRVLYALAIVAAFFLVPFAVYNFLHGQQLLAAGLLTAFVVLAIDSVAIYVRRKPPLPLGLLLVPAIGAMAVTLHEHELYGVFWAYPVVILFHFALSRVKANAHSAVLLAVAVYLVQHYIGTVIAVRFAITLLLTVVLINLALNIIDDLHHQLIEQAILDPLTGAYNRRHMDTCLDHAIERTRRTGTPACLLVIDFDHFKRINDQHGHAAGDRALKELVQIIHRRARRLDLLFRAGGEEFLLLLPDTHEDNATVLAEDIRAAVADAPLLQELRATVSIGVAELHADDSADTWLKHADDALYVAKNTGRDRVVHRASLLFADAR